MLQDIMDEWDIENNFEYILGRYILYLENDGRFKHSAPRAKINFKARLKKLHNDGETEGREYKKLEMWIQKNMWRDQKQAERCAAKINAPYKARCEELESQLAELKKQYEELEEKYFRLMDSDSSDDEPIQKIEY